MFFSIVLIPGETSTSILQRHTNEKVKDMVEKLTAKSGLIPIQRVPQPEDIAQSIMFLANRNRSMYIVGHVLVIDGGASLQMPLVTEGSKIVASIIAGVPIK
ncbi:unnamed protein product [Cylicocyclus nassatus]|uniref:SDR family oxidoreductase n=1 Tax=Cylicocyclus nassatus TaxID=53992 RepID=A0AA36GLA2_CYLNA|nr:unnamed protein product [Cylicocyclus nassatus]